MEISPDCADAYVLLAEHAKTADEAQNLYEQGVAAGERALGREAFAEHEGHFWGVLETRPYMRARQGLAQCLWEAGRRREARLAGGGTGGLSPGHPRQPRPRDAPPLAWELELMEGCLRTIPEFLTEKNVDLVEGGARGVGELTLRLAWVDGAIGFIVGRGLP